VDSTYTLTSGDTTQLAKAATPTSLVTHVSLSGPSLVHGICGDMYTETITGTISTNGPVTVTYHWEIESPGGYNHHLLPDQTIFVAYDTTVTVSETVNRSCGNFIDLLVTTSPNSKTTAITWEILQP
jgi:hypothetical protein